MHNAQIVGPVASDRPFTPVAGPTCQPGDRPAWSTPLLSPLLLGGTRAGGADVPDAGVLADTGSI